MSASATYINGTQVLIPPPHGHDVNFDNPTQRHATIAYINFGIGAPISTFCLLQYLYVKLWIVKKVDAQLVCLTLGWAFAMSLQAIEIYNFIAKIIGVHSWEMPIERAESASYYLLVSSVLMEFAAMFCKSSLCLLYCGLSQQRWWKWTSWSALVLAAGHHVVMLIVILAACEPFERNWNPTISGTCIHKPTIYVATAALSIFSDLVLLTLPIPMVIKLRMPFRQKIGLMAFFTIGSATLVTAIIRLILLLSTSFSVDISWAVSSTAVVFIAESNLLVICTAFPTFKRFFTGRTRPASEANIQTTKVPGNGGRDFPSYSSRTTASSNNRRDIDEFGMAIMCDEPSQRTMMTDSESQMGLREACSLGERSNFPSPFLSLDHFSTTTWTICDDIELQRPTIKLVTEPLFLR